MDTGRLPVLSQKVEQSPQKGVVLQLEHSGSVSLDDAHFLADFSEERQKKAVRKVDVSDKSLICLSKKY